MYISGRFVAPDRRSQPARASEAGAAAARIGAGDLRAAEIKVVVDWTAELGR